MMPPILGSSTAEWADSLLIGLLTFAIRGTVLLLAAWMATRLLRHSSAATRHLVWTSAIAGVLLLPLLTAVVPAWNVPVVTIAANADAPLESPAAVAAPQAKQAIGVAATTSSSPSVASSPVHVAPPARANDAPFVQRALTNLRETVMPRISPRGVVAGAWLVLALLLLARLAIATARVSSWRRSSLAVEDERWLALLRRLSRQYGIERPVVLLENPETDVPVTWGIVYPVILLPATAEQWDEEQRIAVLTHELAHVKRFDALTQLLAQLALALLWFHPLVWMAVRRMRLEREHACDDFVLVAGARASRYADDLLGFARRLTRPTAPAAAALAMARRSELEGRLLAILDPATKRSTVRRARVALLTLAVFALATPLAAFRPSARVHVDPKARATASAEKARTAAAPDSIATKGTEEPKPLTAFSGKAQSLESLMQRVGTLSPSMLRLQSAIPALPRVRTDTEPPRSVDLQTLIDVTKAAKRMSSDVEKGQLLQLIAKRWVHSDALRDAYLDAVSTMSSDMERSTALIALLDRDTLPLSAVAQVLRAASMMSSDMSKGAVLKRIAPATFSDSAVQRAYIEILALMSSDMERASAISTLLKQRLTQAHQIALLRATVPISSNTEKSGVLLLFLDRQGIADDSVRRMFFKTAESLTSDMEYRRVMTAVMK